MRCWCFPSGRRRWYFHADNFARATIILPTEHFYNHLYYSFLFNSHNNRMGSSITAMALSHIDSFNRRSGERRCATGVERHVRWEWISLWKMATFSPSICHFTGSPYDERLEAAMTFLEQVPLIDGHNDLPWNIRKFMHNQINEFRWVCVVLEWLC